MLLTERKAISIMFDDLQDEKRQLKQDYREALADIESRQERLLERLARLDNLEREAIDAEGLLQKMADTAQKMAELLPDIPAEHLINKTAEKMAEKAQESGLRVEATQQAPTEKEAAEKKIESFKQASLIKRTQNVKEVMEKIEEILKESGQPIKSRQIEKELFDRYGWQWNQFPSAFSGWRSKVPNKISKSGGYYFYDENKGEKKHVRQDEIQQAEATV